MMWWQFSLMHTNHKHTHAHHLSGWNLQLTLVAVISCTLNARRRVAFFSQPINPTQPIPTQLPQHSDILVALIHVLTGVRETGSSA